VVLVAIDVCVFQMAVWDRSAMMFVPICLFVAFGAPLFLVLRNLTSVAIVETESVELRRFFKPAWRLDRRKVFHATPTRGILEGPLQLHLFDSKTRVIPGFLVRGMRNTWVEQLRNAPPSVGFAGMSSEDMEAFVKAARRSSVEGDETFGASPEQRWRNWMRWDKTQRFFTSASVGLALLSIFFPLFREVWLLDVLIACAAVGVSIETHLKNWGLRKSGREIVLVIVSLLPGLFFTRGQFDWEILDPGLGTIALYVAGVTWMTSLIPPWRGIVWADRGRYVFLSAAAFGLTAFWAEQMLVFANMRFDRSQPSSVEVASVLRVEERASSRHTPATVVVDLGSSTTFGFGMTARFVHYAMPAGHLAVGGQCVLMVRPGLFHMRWVQVAVCR
jgi:hypothetical protein